MQVKRIEPFLANELFTVEVMTSKSMAAANLCNWVINIHKFNRISVKVKPLMDQLEAARASKAAAEASLAAAQAIVAAVDAKLKILGENFQAATDEKALVEAQAAAGKIGMTENGGT